MSSEAYKKIASQIGDRGGEPPSLRHRVIFKTQGERGPACPLTYPLLGPKIKKKKKPVGVFDKNVFFFQKKEFILSARRRTPKAVNGEKCQITKKEIVQHSSISPPQKRKKETPKSTHTKEARPTVTSPRCSLSASNGSLKPYC